MEKVLGIDLGTTNTVCAEVGLFSDKGTAIENMEGSYTTPSAVDLNNLDCIAVGSQAIENKLIYPTMVATKFKRAMGKEKEFITVNGQTFSPQQLSAFVLKKIKQDAEAATGNVYKKAVISVPAYFSSNSIAATIEAAKMAGFEEVLDTPDEPTCALIHSNALSDGAHKNVLVYDLGGGTLDLVVAKITDTIDEVCIDGDDKLGGLDFDEAFTRYIVKHYFIGDNAAKGMTDAEVNDFMNVYFKPEELQDLYAKVERAKISLSRKPEVNFTFSCGEKTERITVTRAQFEEATKDLLERAMKPLKAILKTMESKGIRKLDQIVFCGGATQMPMIEKAVRSHFKEDIKILSVDVNVAVAQGAAVYGQAIENGKDKLKVQKSFFAHRSGEGNVERASELCVKRVTSRSYGIRAHVNNQSEEEKIYNMVYRNSTLPVTKEKGFCTHIDNHRRVSLPVYENVMDTYSAEIVDSVKIGELVLEIAVDLPKNSPFTVYMTLNEDGTLFVRAEEKIGNTEIKATLKTDALLSDAELEKQKKIVEDIYEKVS